MEISIKYETVLKSKSPGLMHTLEVQAIPKKSVVPGLLFQQVSWQQLPCMIKNDQFTISSHCLVSSLVDSQRKEKWITIQAGLNTAFLQWEPGQAPNSQEKWRLNAVI